MSGSNRSFGGIISLMLSLAGVAAGQSAWVVPPPGGTDMLPAEHIQTYVLTGSDIAGSRVVSVSGMPFDQAIRVNIMEQAGSNWHVQLIMSTTGDIAAGDVGLVCFFVRRVGGGNAWGEVQGAAKHQRASPNWDAVSRTGFRVGGAGWHQIVVPFESPLGLADGEHNLVFHLSMAV